MKYGNSGFACERHRYGTSNRLRTSGSGWPIASTSLKRRACPSRTSTPGCEPPPSGDAAANIRVSRHGESPARP